MRRSSTRIFGSRRTANPRRRPTTGTNSLPSATGTRTLRPLRPRDDQVTPTLPAGELATRSNRKCNSSARSSGPSLRSGPRLSKRVAKLSGPPTPRARRRSKQRRPVRTNGRTTMVDGRAGPASRSPTATTYRKAQLGALPRILRLPGVRPR